MPDPNPLSSLKLSKKSQQVRDLQRMKSYVFFIDMRSDLELLEISYVRNGVSFSAGKDEGKRKLKAGVKMVRTGQVHRGFF